MKLYRIMFLLVIGLLMGCAHENLDVEPSNIIDVSGPQIVENKVKFSNKGSLKSFINGKTEKEFMKSANDLRKRGLEPLVPMFTKEEKEERKKFLQEKKKKMRSKSRLYSSKNYEGAEIELDDELIMDPRFAALLNENREIIVGEHIYIYTTLGLFYSLVEDENKLRSYLAGLDKKSTRNKLEQLKPCDPIGTPTEIHHFISCGGGGGGVPVPPTPPSNNHEDFPLDIKRNLGVCTVDKESLWQKVFGEAETCNDYFASNRRAKTKFWNQNYLVFSSIGMTVKHQKRNWGIWDSSDATDYIEMGLTNVSFKYNFNTAVYDEIFWNIQSDVILEYKGKTYTADGRVIHGYPLGSSPLPLNVNSDKKLTVYLFNRDIEITDAQQVNDLIRDVARDYIEDYGSGLETSLDNTSEDIGLNGVLINPLDNSVTYTIVGEVERRLNASSITKILDFNLLVGTTLKFSGGSYSVGENGPVYNAGTTTTFDAFGATSYTDVVLDMYGVVKRNGDEYRGKRIVSKDLN